MAPQTTLRTLRTLRETKKREATCRALRATSRLPGWPLRPRITRLRAFFERFTPPNRPRRNAPTARPQARSSDAVMDGCCHWRTLSLCRARTNEISDVSDYILDAGSMKRIEILHHIIRNAVFSEQLRHLTASKVFLRAVAFHAEDKKFSFLTHQNASSG